MNYFGLSIKNTFFFNEYNPREIGELQAVVSQSDRLIVFLSVAGMNRESCDTIQDTETMFYKDFCTQLRSYDVKTILFDVKSSFFSIARLREFVAKISGTIHVYVFFSKGNADNVSRFIENSNCRGIGVYCDRFNFNTLCQSISQTYSLVHLHLKEPSTNNLEALFASEIAGVNKLTITITEPKPILESLEMLKETEYFTDNIELQTNGEMPKAIERLLSVLNERKLIPLVVNSIKKGELIEFSRSKLMFVGQGRAGKTSTINSLLHRTFDPNMESTEVLFCQDQIDFVEEGGSLIWVSRGTGVQSFENDLDKVYSQVKYKGDFIAKVEDQEITASNPSNNVSFRREQLVETTSKKPNLLRLRKSFTTLSKFSIRSKLMRKSTKVHSSATVVKDSSVRKNPVTKISRHISTRLNKLSSNYHNLKSMNIKRSLSVWDFGGQHVFYTVHHLFLTNNGVYCLTFNIKAMLENRETEIENLKFWLTSILLYSPKAAILFVATHVEEVDNEDIRTIDREVFQQILEEHEFLELSIFKNEEHELSIFLVDNSATGRIALDKVECLRRGITNAVNKTAQNLSYYSISVPMSWIYFMDSLAQDFSGAVTLQAVFDKAEHLMIPRSEVEKALELYNDFGAILSFWDKGSLIQDENSKDVELPPLANIVILDPQWLMDALKTFIYDKQLHSNEDSKHMTRGYEMTGIMKFSLFQRLLKCYDEIEQNFLIALFKKMLLLSEYSFEDIEEREYHPKWFVPSMCGLNTMPTGLAQIEELGNLIRIHIKTERRQPIGFYERLVCLILRQSDAMEGNCKPHLTNEHCYVDMFSTSVFISKIDSYNVEIKLQKVPSVEIQHKYILIHLEQVLQELYRDKLGNALKPYITLVGDDGSQCSLMKLKQVMRIRHKYVADLENISVSIEKFNHFVNILKKNSSAPLQERIRHSMRRNKNKKIDCFIAHEWGFPETGFKTHKEAMLLKKDLETNGFSVWLDEDNLKRNITQDIIAGLENSIVTIVLITRRYCARAMDSNTHCWKEFNYAAKKGIELMLPLVLDKSLLDQNLWQKKISYHLSDSKYIDFSTEEAKENNRKKLYKDIRDMLEASRGIKT